MKNTLYCGDNLDILRKYVSDESVDLVYIDPPFFSNKHYEVIWGDEAEVRSFEDRWEGGVNVYVEWMKPRIEELYRVLKTTGSFYLHCDWHASAHLRVMADDIFGERNFRNELIWHYDIGGKPKCDFRRKHDVILRYSKGKTVTWNEIRMPPLNPKRYNKVDKNGRRYYEGYGGKWRKYEDEGTPTDDVWTFVREKQFRTLNSQAKERLGYPTQKPEALLQRIVGASSNKGGLVLDAFCGCGTTLVVAQTLGRHWMGIDISPTAVKVMEKRLAKVGAIKDKDYVNIGMPTTVNDLRKLKPFEFQNWVINEMGARQSRRKVGDMGLDGHFVKDLWHEEAGVQVKQSNGVGRPVIDNFKAALERKKYKKGFIVAFSFTKGAYEEAARLKHDEGVDIKLVQVEALLLKKEPIFGA